MNYKILEPVFDFVRNIGAPQLLIGALLGIFLDNFFKQPKLTITGGGSGGGPGLGFYQSNITIRNEPGLLGFKIKETKILGIKINGIIEKGLIFDRFPAHECIASILDKKTGEFIAQLWWRSRTEPNIFSQQITLNSGDSADLMVFARLDNEKS